MRSQRHFVARLLFFFGGGGAGVEPLGDRVVVVVAGLPPALLVGH